jgi:hypothetical protein
MNCIRCNRAVDADRVGALQSMNRPITCLFCSSDTHKIVLMEYGHKTAGVAVVVGSDPEQIRRAQRAYRRAR